METKEELMGRILAADAEQNEVTNVYVKENIMSEEEMKLKEDAVERLGVDAAQDYINELEAQVKILSRNKANVVERLDEYQGENGPYILFKDMLFKALDDEIMAIIKDEVLDGLPDFDDLDSRISEVESSVEDMPDEYGIIDDVVDSMAFETKVDDIITDKLNEVKFKVTIEEE